MRINCLACGHKFDLGDEYGEYAGKVTCPVCGAMLEMRTERGYVKSVTVAVGSGATRA